MLLVVIPAVAGVIVSALLFIRRKTKLQEVTIK